MDVEAYLARIGLGFVGKPDLETLRLLTEQHLIHVPFENLDIHHHRWIRLHCGEILNKIVRERRGGFCYELNSAFGALLRKMGYRVSMVSGRVRSAAGGFGPEYDHMALIVHLEEPWLVDVGFGNSTRQPLPLNGCRYNDISGGYRVKKVPQTEGVYALEKKDKWRWIPEYRFSTVPRRLKDFTVMCEHQQTSPTSVFRQKLIVTRATPQGRISLSNRHLTISGRGNHTKTPIRDIHERNRLIREHFGIDPDTIQPTRNHPLFASE
ncbi:N-hydroxyarylamine O-acetyltransferase [Melghirimyces profundicolus]|uniref:N-hydroxyarylamine O-acetyltransferase n=1 Tax=Melghirimyces profundicolus TaxID=1242148 RepID=A0A2T6C7E5_9BACL|nr:arylamine N-acetyltransferase [Melghirimyces profundicolus]PTX64222.1 N-hydroxyarylamine O-acetyltransferase [Melghirimyces profundicolus]